MVRRRGQEGGVQGESEVRETNEGHTLSECSVLCKFGVNLRCHGGLIYLSNLGVEIVVGTAA